MSHTVFCKYREQRVRAKQRGIGWGFTYDQWVKWWEVNLGPDWYKKRGILANMYCMARKGDTGPYAAWNVECITNSQNAVYRGKNTKRYRGYKRRLITSEQLRSIEELSLNGLTVNAIARKLGIYPATVRYHFPNL